MQKLPINFGDPDGRINLVNLPREPHNPTYISNTLDTKVPVNDKPTYMDMLNIYYKQVWNFIVNFPSKLRDGGF